LCGHFLDAILAALSALHQMALFRQAGQEVRSDIRNTHWNGILLKKILFLFPIPIWTSGLVIVLFVIAQPQHYTGTPRVACTPDGEFSLNPGHYSYWSRKGFFQITLAFGKLSFDNAKLIDVVWDVVSGTKLCCKLVC
jgi:hypothetical protein